MGNGLKQPETDGREREGKKWDSREASVKEEVRIKEEEKEWCTKMEGRGDGAAREDIGKVSEVAGQCFKQTRFYNVSSDHV